jgi:hypothetical protein
MKKLYMELAQIMTGYENCIKSENSEWRVCHRERIEALVREYMPSGSGVDNGTKFNFESSTSERLVFSLEFHHMNSDGCYDGWSYHSVFVTGSLPFGFLVRITGSNKNDIKCYLGELIHEALNAEIDPSFYSVILPRK